MDYVKTMNEFFEIGNNYISELTDKNDFTGFPDKKFPVYNETPGITITFAVQDEEPILSVEGLGTSLKWDKEGCSYDDPFISVIKLASVVCRRWEQVIKIIDKIIVESQNNLCKEIEHRKLDYEIIESFVKKHTDYLS